MAYHALVGRLPFDTDALGELVVSLATTVPPPPSSYAPELTPGIDAWFKVAFQKESGRALFVGQGDGGHVQHRVPRVVRGVRQDVAGQRQLAPADLRGGQRHREAHDADSGPSQRGNCGFHAGAHSFVLWWGWWGWGRERPHAGHVQWAVRDAGRGRAAPVEARRAAGRPGSRRAHRRHCCGGRRESLRDAVACDRGDHGLVGSATGATGQGLQAPSDSSPAPPMVTVSAPPPASAIPSAAPSATASEAAPSASVAPGRSPQASPPRRANPPTQSPTPQPAPPPRPSKPAPKNDYGL